MKENIKNTNSILIFPHHLFGLLLDLTTTRLFIVFTSTRLLLQYFTNSMFLTFHFFCGNFLPIFIEKKKELTRGGLELESFSNQTKYILC